jgi:site-specific DNA-methyltransferase (adenine-specific)
MGQIIWQKSTTMNTSGGGAVMGSFPYPRNGIVKLDFEYIMLFKKQGKAKKPTTEQKELSKMTNEEWNTFFAGHWNFAGSKQDKHLAMFPDELPRRLIKMFSFAGETVLDPFAGSGTTAKNARELGRNSISYEINNDFISVIEDKLGTTNLLSNVIFETIETIIDEDEIQRRISTLPYVFTDTHKLNKIVDVKSLQYGSKIDVTNSKKQEDLYNVKQVISPEIVMLNNKSTVRLIGIKKDTAHIENAMNFMHQKFKGRKVFLKSDKVQYNDNHFPAYLYLDNKIFINAHLLKHGYVHVDNSIPFRLLEKFNNIRYGT